MTTRYTLYNNDCYGCTSASGANGFYCVTDGTCWSSSNCGTSPCYGSSGSNRCASIPDQCSSTSLAAGAIVGIVLTILFVVFLIFLCVWCIRRNRTTTVIVAAAPQPVMYAQVYAATPTYGTYQAVAVERTY